MAMIDVLTPSSFGIARVVLGDTVRVDAGKSLCSCGLYIFDATGLDSLGVASLLGTFYADPSQAVDRFSTGNVVVTDSIGARITLVSTPGSIAVLGLGGVAALRRCG